MSHASCPGVFAWPQHWPLAAHYVDQGWQQARGQHSCPTGTMRVGMIADEATGRLARELDKLLNKNK